MVIVLALLAAGAVGAGSAGARQAATFKYCTDPTFPPMEYATTSGKIVGFDVDMAAALAQTWGDAASALKTAFPGLIPALNSKKCDAVISGIFVTPDRRKQAGVVPYMHTHRVLIVKAGNPKKIHGPNQLKGLAVAVHTQDTSYAYQAKQHPGKIAIGFTFAASDQFGIYFRKADATGVGQQIKDGIASLKSDGTLAKLATKYKIPVTTVK
jgi:polar amino acid transport system substrate-binding protein